MSTHSSATNDNRSRSRRGAKGVGSTVTTESPLSPNPAPEPAARASVPTAHGQRNAIEGGARRVGRRARRTATLADGQARQAGDVGAADDAEVVSGLHIPVQESATAERDAASAARTPGKAHADTRPSGDARAADNSTADNGAADAGSVIDAAQRGHDAPANGAAASDALFGRLRDAGIFGWLAGRDDGAEDEARSDDAAADTTVERGAVGTAVGARGDEADHDDGADGWEHLPPDEEALGGDNDGPEDDESVAWDDLDALRQRIEATGLPAGLRKHALDELANVERAYSDSNYRLMTMRWLRDWMTRLPWGVHTDDEADLRRVAATLDADHYGLRAAKDAVIDFVAAQRRAARSKGKILLLVGPPGVGKTSLARSIARALGRRYARAALGGIRDEGDLRGYSRSYSTAFPGHLIRAMRAARSMNPVICLDEVDKLTPMNTLGCPDAVLLEALDPEQNRAFVDLYMQVAFDLSQVFFVCTANGTAGITPPLLDRMEMVEVPGYTEDEKLHIAERYLVPRHLRTLGFRRDEVVFEREALRALIADYTYEAGVREANRTIKRVLDRLARRLALGEVAEQQHLSITAADLADYLGPRRVRWMEVGRRDEVGVATGLGWAEAGGVTMPVEVTVLPGSGHLRLTGRLGEVLRESAEVAMTYVRGRAEELGLASDVFCAHDIHVHLPAAAIAKDGPSAGVAIATALVSALSGRAVRHDVGMSGELTPRGRVLPVGGVREKVVAAARAGLALVLIPEANMTDVEALGADILGRLRVAPVTTMGDVLGAALVSTHPDPGMGRT